MINARPSSPSPQRCAVQIRLAAYLNTILANTMRPVVRLGLILAYQNGAHIRVSSQGPSASESRAEGKAVLIRLLPDESCNFRVVCLDTFGPEEP